MLREGLETDLFPLTQGDPFPADQSALRGRLIRQPIEDVPIVDGYEFHEEIGRGGMGVVYHAEQTRPIRRRVAIKLIKLGMDTKQVIGRFEAERQALAMMDHPNVARVLGAGASDTGRPYFVMEMVRGPKITDYCDRFKLSTRERLELFLQVCRAIQHAHQKGLIHRDIKPSNILVTQQDGAAVPKVIDFGIAKATGGISLTDKTVCTGVCEFLGTPAYTSPEQAVGGRDIDTRTDIYSLGVLLYELLTGCTPFDSNQLLRSGWEAMRRTISETEPQRPSTRLTSLAPEELSRISHRRRVESPRLIHLVRGDLDWIAMKCLEKERERRYSTCSSIIDDLERHLRHETVLARPPSAAYKVQKLVRRNALGFALGAVVATSILFAVGAAAWSLTKQAQARAMLRYFEKIHVIRDVLPGSRSGVGPVSAIAEIPHIPSIDWVNSLRVEPGGLRPGSALAMRLTSGALLGTNEVSLVQSANGEGVESTNNLALQSLLPASLAQSGTPGNEAGRHEWILRRPGHNLLSTGSSVVGLDDAVTAHQRRRRPASRV
jgi:serine/threonine protein kinase